MQLRANHSLLVALGCCALVLALTYPVQFGRAWSSRIFPPPPHLNIDAPEWMAIVQDSPFLGHTLPMHVSRPLYPAPAYCVRHYLSVTASPQVLLRSVNIVWVIACIVALYWFSLFWTHSPPAAVLSAVLFCASPCVQIYLSQPVPTIIGCAAGIVPLALVTWASRAPSSAGRWLLTGFASAVLMLGKEVYPVYLCLLLVAISRRAWKPMLLFGAAALAVHVGWIAVVRFGIHRPYAPYGENQQGFVSWIWTDFLLRTPAAQAAYIVRLTARVVLRTLDAFEFWPIPLATMGWYQLSSRPKFELISYLLAFTAMFFTINIVTPRICFLMFPAVYTLASLAIVNIAVRAFARSHALTGVWIALVSVLVAISALADPYDLFYYG